MSANDNLYGCLGNAARRFSGLAANLAVEICQVSAPTGSEADRAELVARLWRERGYHPESDEVGNVVVRRGTQASSTLMLAAHLDTVFPIETPIKIERRGDRILAPGIGDNSLGIAAMMTLGDMLDELQIELPISLLMVADVGEEGLGNLAGVRSAVDAYREELGAFIAVEGHNLGRVTNVGVGSKRWRVRVQGPGGHSWGAYGAPNAIHILAKAITEITGHDLPTSPRTTFNVGVMHGGTSVNTIAAVAEATIDMRSTEAGALEELATIVRRALQRLEAKEVSVAIDVLGERPVGGLESDHPLVEIGRQALRSAGVDPVLDASSTDANYPLSLGIPSICIGITRGGRGHSVDEYISVSPISTGLAQLARLVVDTAHWLDESS